MESVTPPEKPANITTFLLEDTFPPYLTPDDARGGLTPHTDPRHILKATYTYIQGSGPPPPPEELAPSGRRLWVSGSR